MQTPEKDEIAAHPVATAWRHTLSEIVRALVSGNYALAGVDSVAPVPIETQKHIQTYLDDFGETLIALPEETWQSSCAQWMGTHWEVLVDLWTKESGRSDLVLHARVLEHAPEQYEVEVHLVYVP